MNRRRLTMVAALSFALVLGLIGMEPGQAQAPKTAYPSMAPLDQYLMPDRNAEIALARSAAPDAISGDAKILVLGRHGYETAVEGKNGFVCVVERGDVPFRWPGVLEPQNSRPNLFQSAGRAIRFADHIQENRDGISRANKG